MYAIYAHTRGSHPSKTTYEFGITRQADEDTRPKSQYGRCMEYYGHASYAYCDHDILARVIGWFPARTEEADYTLAYALNHNGKCPQGDAQVRVME